MAEYVSQSADLPGEEGEKRYEIVMLASGIDGAIVDSSSPLPVTGGAGPDNSLLVSIGGTTVDAFSRLRVSAPFTLADYNHVYGEEPELLTLSSGAGSTVISRPNEASMRLTVGTGSTDYVIHQSRMHHHYMPGKSQLAMMSFAFGLPRTNTVKRIGLFGQEDGVYFQQDGSGIISFVKRTSISGTVVDESPVVQSNWNIDRCDGTGKSGFDLAIENTQLLFCDYQWLGVGRLRLGFVHDGNFIVAHEFRHSNNLSTVYWRNPNLPVRCEIRNTGVAAGTSYMDQICSTVMSEGGYSEAGINFSKYSENISLVKGNPGVAKCLIAIKLKDTYSSLPNRSIVRLTDMGLLSDSAPVVFELWRLPSAASNITGGTWVDTNTSSCVQYNTTIGTSFNTTGGELFSSGFVAANNPSGKQSSGGVNMIEPAQAKRIYLSQNITSTDSNVFVLIARNLSTTADTATFATFQWKETR